MAADRGSGKAALAKWVGWHEKSQGGRSWHTAWARGRLQNWARPARPHWGPLERCPRAPLQEPPTHPPGQTQLPIPRCSPASGRMYPGARCNSFYTRLPLSSEPVLVGHLLALGSWWVMPDTVGEWLRPFLL